MTTMSIIPFLKTLSIFKQLRFENVFQNTFCYPWTMVYVWMLFGYYLIFYMANDKILTYICLFRNIFVKCLMYNTTHEHSIVDSIIIITLRCCCCCCRPHSTNVLPAESSTRIMWQPTVSPPRWQGKAPLCRDSSRGPG